MQHNKNKFTYLEEFLQQFSFATKYIKDKEITKLTNGLDELF